MWLRRQKLEGLSRRRKETEAPFNVSLCGYITGPHVQVEGSLGLYKAMGIHRVPV